MRFENSSISRSVQKPRGGTRLGAKVFRLGWVLLLMSTFIVQPAFSQSESPSTTPPGWNVETVDGPRFFTNMTDRSLAFRPDGVPCAAYGADNLYYACYQAASNTWKILTVDNTEDVGQYAALTFFSNPATGVTNAFISYYDNFDEGSGTGQLRFAYTTNSVYSAVLNWAIFLVPTPAIGTMTEEISFFEPSEVEEDSPYPAPVDPQATAALDSTGTAEPAAESTLEAVEPETESLIPAPEITDAATPMEVPTPVPTIPGTEEGSLPAGPEQTWFDRYEAGQIIPLPELRPYAEGALADLDTTNKGAGKYTSIAANINGVYISYYDDRDNITNATTQKCMDPGIICERNLKVAFWSGIAWKFNLVDDYADQGKVGLWSSIKVDTYGHLHLAYMSEKYDSLKYAFWNRSNNDWTKIYIDGEPPASLKGSMCSIALLDDDLPNDGRTRDTPVISYLDFGENNLKAAKLTHWSDNTTWVKQTFDSVKATGWYTSIAIDSDDRIHISYFNATNGDLKYARGKWGEFTTTTVRSEGGIQGLFSSIALNPALDERPAILHLNITTGQLLLTYRTSTTRNTWDTRLVDTRGDVGYAASLVISDLGFPHISYLDVTMGNVKYALKALPGAWSKTYPVPNARYIGIYNSLGLEGEAASIAAYNSADKHYDLNIMVPGATESGWKLEEVADTYDVGRHVSLAIDSTGRPHMSYYDATNGNLVYGSQTNAGVWITQTLDFIGDLGQFTSLTLDSFDRPYVSYYDVSNTALKFTYRVTDVFWSFPLTVDSFDEVGMFSSVAVDSSNYPHIVYYDETNQKPKYAYFNGIDWTVETIDAASTHSIGRYTDIAIYQGDNTRHVCYVDATTHSLIYARRSNGTWNIVTMDDVGDTGYSCSIDVNNIGEPAIAYYNHSLGDLKFAYTDLFVIPSWPYSIWLPVVGKN